MVVVPLMLRIKRTPEKILSIIFYFWVAVGVPESFIVFVLSDLHPSLIGFVHIFAQETKAHNYSDYSSDGKYNGKSR